MGRVLAFDYGNVRTGLAVTDPLRIIATPLQTVATRELFAFLHDYLAVEEVDEFVVGFPVTLKNEPSAMAPAVIRFIQQLRETYPSKPVHRADERFTSSMAIKARIEGGVKKSDRKKKEQVDKISATLILQTFLKTR